MKDDAELVYIKYEKRLHDLEEKEKSVIDKLQTRLNQLDTENKSVKQSCLMQNYSTEAMR